MNLSPTMSRFVLHWGEMGARWGVSRTVAQIHALLFLSGRPLHAEAIAEVLQVARSNVSSRSVLDGLRASPAAAIARVRGMSLRTCSAMCAR